MRKLDLRLGATVYCGLPQQVNLNENCCGRLTALVVDPRPRTVCRLVVEYGLLRKQSRVLPLSAVSTTENGDIFLRITRRIWDLMPELQGQGPEKALAEQVMVADNCDSYDSNSYDSDSIDNAPTIEVCPEAAPDTGIPPHTVLVDTSTPVESLNDTLGYLAHVSVDSKSGNITQIVLERGIFPSFYAIPGQYVEEIQPDYVLISLTNSELKRLSEAGEQTDDELERRVRAALIEEGAVGFAAIDPVATDGTVYLRGHVPSTVCKLHAEELVRLVIGVNDVCNELRIEQCAPATKKSMLINRSTAYKFDANMAVVSAALAADPRTRDAIIDVIDDRGIVILQGHVANLEMRKAAESITAGISGVTSVINELSIAA